MGFQVALDDVDVVVEKVRACGVRNVSDEAAEVNLPGVWVAPIGRVFDRLGSYTLNVELRLVVDDQNPRRSRQALDELLNQVLTKFDVVRHEARTYALPEHQPALVPGYRVPVNVRIKNPDPPPEEP